MTKKKAVKAKPKARKVLTQREKDLNKLLKLSIIGCHDMRPLVRQLVDAANDGKNYWSVMTPYRQYQHIVYSVYFAILARCTLGAVMDLVRSCQSYEFWGEEMNQLIVAIYDYKSRYRV